MEFKFFEYSQNVIMSLGLIFILPVFWIVNLIKILKE